MLGMGRECFHAAISVSQRRIELRAALGMSTGLVVTPVAPQVAARLISDGSAESCQNSVGYVAVQRSK